MKRSASSSRGLAFALAAAFVSWFVVGCAGYAYRIAKPRALYESGNYDGAQAELLELIKRADNDQLLYLMDLGMVQHSAGRYAEAIKTFQQADKLAEIKDYTSLSQEAGSILLSDEVKPYKGEDFEKILINVYLAIDYTLLGQWESALVECRRVNHKLDLMISQGQLPYERNAFAKYLAGVLFEAQGEVNDAFVDYRQLLKWKPGTPYLDIPLLRLSEKMGAEQELESYKKLYPGTQNYRLGKDKGEIVVLVEQGKAPIKVPSVAFRLLPQFIRRSYGSDSIKLRVGALEARSAPLYDIEATAIRDLDHRVGLIAAKKIAGVVAKELAGKAVEKATDNKLLGALTAFALHAQDQADLRSWTTLPARLHVARLVVPAGRHAVDLDMFSRSGGVIGSVKRWENVEVKPGKIVFLNYRTKD